MNQSERPSTDFPSPSSPTTSAIYSVTANGEPVPVSQSFEYHHAQFAFSGECEVAVSVKPTIGHRNLKYIHRYTLQPARREVPSSSALNTLRFKLTQPTHLIIQINEYERLFLFADAVESDAPKLNSAGVVNAADFFKDTAGRVVQTAQLQQAVAATPKNGVLHFPPGIYLTGAFHLKSDMTLHLARGAVIKGSPDPADYPPDTTSPYWSKSAFLNVANAANVTICGHGAIDGNGSVVRAAQAAPHLLIARDSSNIVVRDIHVRDAAAWTLHTINCDDVTLRNVKVLNNWDVLNTDGIDLTSCRRVHVEGCFVYSSDDGIVVKTFEGIPCDSVVARRNIVFNKKSALKIGTETKGNVSNVTFIENDVVLCDRGMSLYVEDGAVVSNTQFIANHFDGFHPDARRRLLDFYTWNRNGGGEIRNVLVKDCVAARKWPRPSTILNGHGVIDGVRFENFTLAGNVCRNLREADVLVEVLPCNDIRNPGVRNISFSPSDTLQTWNPALA
jgi:polygalacturonase